MSDKVDALQFEIERRAIQLKYNTNMPDDTTLGYDGDPNAAVNGNSSGETLIYNVAKGSTFFQSDGTWWLKKALPNSWDEIGVSGSTTTGKVVTKTIAPGNTEIFYVLDLSNNDSFDFTVVSTMGTNRERSKLDAMYDPTTDAMLFNTYSYLAKTPLDLVVNIYNSGGNCTFEITNNETSDVTCNVQLMTFYEV